MVAVKCPKCQSKIEIDVCSTDPDKIAVFCSNSECLFHDNPLIGLDKKEAEVFISESLI
jgi:hypothetical protein